MLVALADPLQKHLAVAFAGLAGIQPNHPFDGLLPQIVLRFRQVDDIVGRHNF